MTPRCRSRPRSTLANSGRGAGHARRRSPTSTRSTRSYGYTGRHDRDPAELDAVRAHPAAPARSCSPPTATPPSSSSTRCWPRPQAVPQLVRHDDVGLAPARGRPRARRSPTRIVVETAMAMIDVIRADEMSRLGVCADDDCEGVVLDLSRNRSRRFCSTTCGNRNAVAAYRARQAAPEAAAQAEEPPQHLDEDLRLLGVHPVPGALDRHPAVPREPAVHRRDVLVAHVVGVRPADPQHRPVVRRGPGQRVLGPAAEHSAGRGRARRGWAASASRRRRVAGSGAGSRAPSGSAPPSASAASASPRRVERGQVEALHRVDVAGELAASVVGHRRRRRRRTAARRARGAAAPAPSRPCRPSSARPASTGSSRATAARPPGRRRRRSRSARSTASGRGGACRPAAPGGRRRAPWRSRSSSGPGRTARGRRRPATRGRRTSWCAGSPDSLRSPSRRTAVGSQAHGRASDDARTRSSGGELEHARRTVRRRYSITRASRSAGAARRTSAPLAGSARDVLGHRRQSNRPVVTVEPGGRSPSPHLPVRRRGLADQQPGVRRSALVPLAATVRCGRGRVRSSNSTRRSRRRTPVGPRRRRSGASSRRWSVGARCRAAHSPQGRHDRWPQSPAARRPAPPCSGPPRVTWTTSTSHRGADLRSHGDPDRLELASATALRRSSRRVRARCVRAVRPGRRSSAAPATRPRAGSRAGSVRDTPGQV